VRRLLPILLVAGCASDPLTGPHDLYRLTGEQMPKSSQASVAYGIDVDGTGKSNSLGELFQLMVQEDLGNPQAGTNQVFTMQPPALVIDVQHSAQNDVVGVNAFAGDVAAYDPSSPPQPPLVAVSAYPTVTVAGGDLPAVIAPFGVAIPLVMHDAHVTLTAGPDFVDGIVSGAIDTAIVTDQLAPQWQPIVQALVARDCTRRNCGCEPGTPGETAEFYFDTNKDCTISVDEILSSTIVHDLLTAVTADGRPIFTFGFGVSAAFVRTVD
jgi:hypothetical protein